MFKLVGKDDYNFAVIDTTDGVIDILSPQELTLCLTYGLTVCGAYLDETDKLNYTEDFFIREEDEEEDDDSFEFEYEDDEFEEEEYEEEYEEEEFEEEFEEEYEEEEYEEEDYDDYYEDDDIDIYADDEDEDDSVVSRLYSCLTDEQILILKRYYIWYSQRIFTSAQKDPTLGMKDPKRLAKKKADLDSLRKTGGLWHYAGFVDNVKKGNDYCTLGHPLRYTHLAWDVTVSDIDTAFFGQTCDKDFYEAIESNNCIKFGIKCIGDFFEVSKDCVRALNRVQREALNDMKILHDIYTTKSKEEIDAISDSFKFTDEVEALISKNEMKRSLLQKDYKSKVDLKIFALYKQCRNANLIPPKSLIQELRDKLVGWDGHKFYGSLRGIKDESNLKLLLGINFNYDINSRLSYKVKRYLDAALCYEICGYYKYNGNTNSDEGGKSKNIIYEYSLLYRDVEKRFFKDITYSIDYLKSLVQFYNELQPLLDTIEKIDAYGFKLDDQDSYSYRKLSIILDRPDSYADFLSRYSDNSDARIAYFKLLELKNNYSFNTLPSLYDFIKEIKPHIDIMNSILVDDYSEKALQFAIKRCDELTKMHKEELIKKAEEEKERIKEEEEQKKEKDAEVLANPDDNKVEWLLLQDNLPNFTDRNLNFAKQILETVRKQKMKPTSKQLYYLNQLYDAIKAKSDKVKLSDRPDLEEALDFALSKTAEELRVDERTLNICKSVKKFGTISVKQMKYVEQINKIYKEKKDS